MDTQMAPSHDPDFFSSEKRFRDATCREKRPRSCLMYRQGTASAG